MITFVETDAKYPKIAVCGVGGAGGNIIASLVETDLGDVEPIVVNTDQQVLNRSRVDNAIQIGEGLTRGMGTGGNPAMGEQAAEEARDQICEALDGVELLFLTCGLGGGTGTGATPVIASIAKQMNILTAAIVTKPFDFEGDVRMKQAVRGQDALRRVVDTLITIPNQRLLEMDQRDLSLVEAFRMSDFMVCQCVQSIGDLIRNPGFWNVDFSDLRAIMSNSGGASMGVGRGSGPDRMREAMENASQSPLMEEPVLHGARSVLVNITASESILLHEIDEAVRDIVQAQVDSNANIICGVVLDEKLGEDIQVTLVATGFEAAAAIASHDEDMENEERMARVVGGFETFDMDLDRPAYEAKVANGVLPGGGEAPRSRSNVLPAVFGGGAR